MLILFLAAALAVGEWPVPQSYRMQVMVEPLPAGAAHVPFSVDIDFGEQLAALKAEGDFDPASVAVMRVGADGEEGAVAHALSEDFAWNDEGAVSWVVDDPGRLVYHVYFDILGRGPYPAPGPRPLVGNGDNLRSNRPGGRDPVRAMGMAPISRDFDGDGRIDLVSRGWYSSTWGQPWFPILFWRNTGTNADPVYADFVRLHADDAPVSSDYKGCDLYDWDGDGLPDMVTVSAVYRNTGRLNAVGAPILTKIADLPPLGLKGEPYCFFVGMRDHDQDGVYDAFYLLSGVHYIYEGEPARNFVKGALYRKANAAGAGEVPVLDAELPIERAGEVWSENLIPSDFHDMDGDGDLDIVGNNLPLDRIPSRPQYCYWPNLATKGAPPEYGKPRLIPNGFNMGGYGIWHVDNAAYRGLFVEEGYAVRYLEQTGRTEQGQVAGYTDRGLLQQTDSRCAVDGFSGVEVEDWEGDGDWDLISGDEYGHVRLVLNTGNNEAPVFGPPEPIKANGELIRVMRWHYVQDANPEYYLGQTKPRYADWDGDGDFDLVVANNTNRLLWFENIGSRETPEFTRAEMIRVGEDAEAFAWRCGPAIVDWNGDGLADLVTQCKEGRLSIFLRARQEAGLCLLPGQALLDEAGNPVTAGQVEVCDWDGDGDWDIIAQAGEWSKAGPAFFENARGNDLPRLKASTRLTCWGREITVSAHEHSFAAVDWYGTGKLDLVCGGESGLFYFFRRPALDAASRPSAHLRQAEKRP